MVFLDLEQAKVAGPSRCGAKAARLGMARAMGAQVLPGRVLPNESLLEVLSVPTEFLSLLDGPAPGDATGRRRLREQIATQARGVRWLRPPEPIVTSVLAALSVDPGAGLVVRSSAVQEDGARFSWAGIFESVFCAATPRALAEGIRVVWASQFSHRAYLYARRAERRTVGGSMAVLIQPALVPEVGGVAFSQNPIDSTSERRLVEAAWGLPKAVVDASGATDRYTFGPGVTALQVHVGTKTTRLDLRVDLGAGLGVDGVVTRTVEGAAQQAPCLSPERLGAIDDLLVTLEAGFQGPQDIEWAFSDAGLTLLQARPQTTGFFTQPVAQTVTQPAGAVATQARSSARADEDRP